MRQNVAITFLFGIFELGSLGAFLIGYFANLPMAMIVGGCLVVLNDILSIALGVLNPLFPLILAAILAYIMDPWYVGVFWASAAFAVLNIPQNLLRVVSPRSMAPVRNLREPEE